MRRTISYFVWLFFMSSTLHAQSGLWSKLTQKSQPMQNAQQPAMNDPPPSSIFPVTSSTLPTVPPSSPTQNVFQHSAGPTTKPQTFTAPQAHGFPAQVSPFPHSVPSASSLSTQGGFGQTPILPTTIREPGFPPVQGIQAQGTVPTIPSRGVGGANVFGTPTTTHSSDGLLSFDPNLVRVELDNRHWVIKAGDEIIKDFGHKEKDAMEASRLIRAMKLDGLGGIGNPRPVMEFWLSGGKAPAAPLGHHRLVALDVPQLRVERDRTFGYWMLMNNSRTLFTFGDREEDARRALEVIRSYGFTHVIAVGQSAPTMLVFVASNDGKPVERPLTPEKLAKPEIIPASFSAPNSGTSLTDQPGRSTPTIVPPGSSGVRSNGTSHAGTQSLSTSSLTQQQHSLQPTSFAHRSSGISSMGTKVQASGVPTERVTFDNRQVQVRKQKDVWVMASGSLILGSFGQNERDAREAWKALQRFRLNEFHHYGGKGEGLDFYLESGRPPLGRLMGVQTVALDTETLSVQPLEDRFAIVNHEVIYWQFKNREDAQEALAALKKHRFDSIVHIGTEGTGFTFLTKLQ